MRRIKRIWTVAALGIPAAAVVFALASPLWLPAALKLLAGNYGVAWEQAEAEGFQSLRFQGVTYVADGLRVTVDEVRLPQPGPYIMYRLGQHENLEIRLGRADLRRVEGARKEGGGAGPRILKTLPGQLSRLSPNIPDLKAGRITVGTDKADWFDLSGLHWQDKRMEGRFSGWGRIPPMEGSLNYAEDELRIRATETEDNAATSLEMVAQTGGGEIRAELRFVSAGQPLSVSAVLGPDSWIPRSLHAQADAWPVPDWLIVETPDEVTEPEVSLSLEAEGTEFSGNLHLRARAEDDGQILAKVQFSGDPAEVRISGLSLDAAWIEAELSSAVRFAIEEQAFLDDAEFRLKADLSGQEWIRVSGLLEGRATFQAGPLRGTKPGFSVRVRDFAWQDWKVPRMDASGSLDYPVLVMEEIRVDLPDEGGLQAGGSWNLDTEDISADMSFTLPPYLLEERLAGFALDSALEGKIHLSGKPQSLDLSGTVNPFRLEHPDLHALSVELSWQGNTRGTVRARARIGSEGGGLLTAESRYERGVSGEPDKLIIDSLSLGLGGEHPLLLGEPAEVSLDAKAPLGILSITELSMQGGPRSLDLRIDPPGSRISARLSGMDLEMLQSWLARRVPPLRVEQLDLNITRLTPFLEGEGRLSIHSTDERIDFLSLEMDGSVAGDGILIHDLSGMLGEELYLEGNIRLPIRLVPFPEEAGPFLEIREEGSLAGSMSANFSQAMADSVPDLPWLQHLNGLQFDLSLDGTLESPVARLQASLPEGDLLSLLDPRFSGVGISDIRLAADLSPDLLQVRDFSLVYASTPVEGEAFIPLDRLQDWIAGKKPDWKELFDASGFGLRFRNLEAFSLEAFLPGWIRPTGQLALDLSKERHKDLSGKIGVNGLSLRPTLYSQAISEIKLALQVKRNRVEIASASMEIGQSTVELDGYADFSDFNDPLYELSLTGTRTPLVRTPNLLLHADLDLSLAGGQKEPPRISGSIRLRESILLMDIDPLSARTAGQSLPAPPFFQIEEEPFSDWGLDIAVSGEDALKLKSHYVGASISAQFQYAGTLGNPLLVGNVHTRDGYVDFPGTSLSLTRSEIFVTRERQDALQLEIKATGRTASHVLSMNIRGTARDPQVEFSATPMLSNARIFNLLATGSLEGNNLSSVGFYFGKSLFSPAASSSSFLDRLTVNVGQDITESGADTIDVYYRLAEDWRIHAEYDKYDAQNIGLEWDVFTR